MEDGISDERLDILVQKYGADRMSVLFRREIRSFVGKILS